jgi:hypothetical protein
MAKVKKVCKLISLDLSLSEIEASVLFQVLRLVGGPPEGPRGAIDGILEALRDARIPPATFETEQGSRSIYFK